MLLEAVAPVVQDVASNFDAGSLIGNVGVAGAIWWFAKTLIENSKAQATELKDAMAKAIVESSKQHAEVLAEMRKAFESRTDADAATIKRLLDVSDAGCVGIQQRKTSKE